MPRRPKRSVEPPWAALRPVLLLSLTAANVFVLAALAITQRDGWLPPFIAFSCVFVGLIGWDVWALRHRYDDD